MPKRSASHKKHIPIELSARHKRYETIIAPIPAAPPDPPLNPKIDESETVHMPHSIGRRRVSTEAELREAIATVDPSIIIELINNIDLSETLFIQRDIQLAASDFVRISNPYNMQMLRRGTARGSMIVVRNGATLSLIHIVLDGGSNTGEGAIITVDPGGTLHARAGVVLTHSHEPDIGLDSPAIYNNGALVLDGAVLTDNHSDIGGAVRNTGNMVIKNAGFVSNIGRNAGGAIANEGRLLIKRAIFKNSFSEGYGGAIYNADGAELVLPEGGDNIIFEGNKAGEGGAIFFDRTIDGQTAASCLPVRSASPAVDEAINAPTTRVSVYLQPVEKITDDRYLIEEFTASLYDYDNNLVRTVPLQSDMFFYPGTIDVDTSYDGIREWTLVEDNQDCPWTAENIVRYQFTTNGSSYSLIVMPSPPFIINHFKYPARCQEPESHCFMTNMQNASCPGCNCEPPPLVANESVFLPVARRWSW